MTPEEQAVIEAAKEVARMHTRGTFPQDETRYYDAIDTLADAVEKLEQAEQRSK